MWAVSHVKIAAPSPRAALVVAHPGHELALHGWLEEAHPVVFVLTDGSGADGRSRLPSTRALLSRVGAEPGRIFGAGTDRLFYAALVSRDTAFFRALAGALEDAIVDAGIGMAVADAAEGCRLVADAAVRGARARGQHVTAWDYPLTRPADADIPLGALRFVLDEDALARKRAAADAYPEMRAEVEASLVRDGPDAHRVETLRPVDPDGDPFHFGEAVCGYETFGERRVAAGRYERVIRFREHVRPVAEVLGAMRYALR
jgi:hypothetical protein